MGKQYRIKMILGKSVGKALSGSIWPRKGTGEEFL
jgi:hypothetical protein